MQELFNHDIREAFILPAGVAIADSQLFIQGGSGD